MARHFKVADLIEPVHRDALRDLMLDPRSTIDAASKWLRERGYAVSRSAVGTYRRHLRKQQALEARPQGIAGSDRELRVQITDWIERLEGRDLVGVAIFAAFAVNATTGGK